MILYFSGTGNSRMVATRLAELLHERTHNIEEGPCPMTDDAEMLGIVFPVYAWGLPHIVESYFNRCSIRSQYVWAVMTCGDDMGYADRCMHKALPTHLSNNLRAIWSVQMPNTYVCLPGFDVDPIQLADKKVSTTLSRLPMIADSITARESVTDVVRGDAAWLKTYVLRPLFNAFLVSDKPFKTSSSCTSCGLCSKSCPCHNIQMKDGHPLWLHKDCTGCLRCYHSCPKRSIDWGRYTKGKGQK